MSLSSRPSARLSAADLVRFRRRVLPTTACYVWMGAVGSDGYGKFSLRDADGGERVVSPHQVAAGLAFGPIPLGSTLMHDCDVRVCVSTAPGHVRIATQGENMRQAARRGRAAGPRPGMVDTRGKVGASRAVQAALRDHPDADPAALAVVLAATLAEGDPVRHLMTLFDPPPARPQTTPDDGPLDLFDLLEIIGRTAPPTVLPAGSLPLFTVGRDRRPDRRPLRRGQRRPATSS